MMSMLPMERAFFCSTSSARRVSANSAALDDAGRIDGRLDTGVTATDHHHALAPGPWWGQWATHPVRYSSSQHVQVAPAAAPVARISAALQVAPGEVPRLTILADGGGAACSVITSTPLLLGVLLQAGGQQDPRCRGTG